MTSMEKTMDNATKTAKEILTQNGYTCVLYLDGTQYHATQRGVKPLVEFLESGRDFRGFCAADKTVGLGAAHLYVLLGVKSVWANVMSEAAKALLLQRGIAVFCEHEVPFIINRKGDGVCPVEAAVTGITCSQEALVVIIKTLNNLQI